MAQFELAHCELYHPYIHGTVYNAEPEDSTVHDEDYVYSSYLSYLSPGGVIFPLFFAGSALAQGLAALCHLDKATTTLAFMAAIQATYTSTPVATSLMLVLSMDRTTEPLRLYSIVTLAAGFTALYPARRSR